MIYAGRLAVLSAIALIAGTGEAVAGGDVYGGEPVAQGPRDSFSSGGSADAGADKGFGPPAASGAQYPGVPAGGPPDDRAEANAEAQFVDGDPYGRTDYWQDGRGNRLGTQFGPGYYQKGYYHPGERQFPDYSQYDEDRAGKDGSLWTFVGKKVIDPFVPTQAEIDYARALPVRVVTKLRLDEDLRRLRALARERSDAWAGGRYDSPRPLK